MHAALSFLCHKLIGTVVYLYFPETSRLTLEEIGAQFGDDIAVQVSDESQDEREKLERTIENSDDGYVAEGARVRAVERIV